MLIDSVIIVLREVLEAALLIAMLLAAAHRLEPRVRFRFARGIALGTVGAVLFGMLLLHASGWFDGAGYELLNSGLRLLIYLNILTVLGLLAGAWSGSARPSTWLSAAMVAVVALAITREGAEILLYFSSFMRQLGATSDALTGVALGLGVGMSSGALFYYALIALPPLTAQGTIVGLLALMGAGKCTQAITLLVQADWLPAQSKLWDSSTLLSESSLPGQLLAPLIGYEATPPPLQVAAYLASLGAALAIFALGARSVSPAEPGTDAS